MVIIKRAVDIKESDMFADNLLGFSHAFAKAKFPEIKGLCYTQFADTSQEQNGLLKEDRTPKVDADRLRKLLAKR